MVVFAPSVSAYDGSAAAKYAKKYYKNYNSACNKWSSDCTNFASQCVFAGGESMKIPSTVEIGVTTDKRYWYSIRYQIKTSSWGTTKTTYKWAESSTWIRVSKNQGFYCYWKGKKTTYTSKNLDAIRKRAKVGDVIQVRGQDESYKGHSMVVGSKSSSGEITLYYHTEDKHKTLEEFDKDYRKGGGTNTYTLYSMNS